MSLFKPNKIEEIKPGLFVQSNKKGKYRQVYPIVKDVSKPFGKDNINWKNMFRVDWMTIVLILLMLVLLLSYYHDLKQFNKVMTNDCVKTCAATCTEFFDNFSLNLTTLNFNNSVNYNLSV